MHLKRNIPKLIALIIWAAVFGYALHFQAKMNLSSLDLLKIVYEKATQTSLGPLLYIVVYTLRPIILFPAMWLTILSGGLFGFLGGVVYTVIGENLSASLAYFMGRLFAFRGAEDQNEKALSWWRKRIEEKAFMTILIMRLIYLPFDLVNFSCGALRVPWKAYALATFIGIMPGLVTFVSIGASANLEELFANDFKLDGINLFHPRQVAISVGLFVASLGLAKYVQRTQGMKESISS